MFFNLPRPTVIAHRGASAHAPENSMASFKLAISHRADALEFDVKLTLDKQVVVIHDQTVDRTTNGTGRVNHLKLTEIKELDAGAWFGPQFRSEKIPTLNEVFETFGRQTFYNVELTNYVSPSDGLSFQVANLVKKHHLEQQVIFSSFDFRNLIRAHRVLPEVPCGLLTPGSKNAMIGLYWLSYLFPCSALHPNMVNTTPKLVQSLHRRGKRVYVYTVNDAQEIRKLQNWDVDGIITDDPPLARQILFP